MGTMMASIIIGWLRGITTNSETGL